MNQYEVDLQIERALDQTIADKLLETAAATLAHEQVAPPGQLTILITGDAQIQQLNRDFLGQDKTTDVLSFPAGNQMPGMEPYLGDIAISVAFAERQARDSGHGLLAEMQLLVVHGILHLLGYDHASSDERTEMWQVQASILSELGAEITGPAVEV